MKTRIEIAAKALARLAPSLLLKRFRSDCCIAATRVAVQTMRRLGFQADPQPTRLYLYTLKLWERLPQFDGNFLDGEWGIGVGIGPDKPGSYDGHLVCVSQEILIDLALSQAQRPGKGIIIPGGWTLPIQEWPLAYSNGEVVAIYEKHDNMKFLQSPDWTDETRSDPIVEAIVATIGKRLTCENK